MSVVLCSTAIVLTVARGATPDPQVRIGKAAFYEECPAVKKAVGYYRRAYGRHRHQMGLSGPVPRAWYGCDTSARRAVQWRERAAQARVALERWWKREGEFGRLAVLANRAIADGQAYSTRWGDASPWLRQLCERMIRLAFRPHGTEEWALHVVNRESGCNPKARNHTYSDPGQQATGIAQYIPDVHTWVDYDRLQRDMRYAIHTFLRMSRGGHVTGPWSMG